VRSIPTVILFARGTVQDTLIGVQPQQQYVRRLDAVSAPAA
jgi:thioredoxin-like negative regulator of GroEL